MTQAIVITGGAGGIGLAIAKRMSEQGYRCLVLDRSPPPRLDRIEHVEVDLADPNATSKVLARICDENEITRVVNNVGIARAGSLESVQLEDFEASVSLNLRTAIQVTQSFIPTMKHARFGRIVNISSRVALGKKDRSVYAATKAGLHGLSKTWALEFAQYGVTVNVVAPGPIETSLHRSLHGNSEAEVVKVPVGRLGQPEDVAEVVSFFLSERTSFVTGQVLYVCGGVTIGLG